MSIWMKVAAGCPFRRVITSFPSMTPGDTTVTFHLSQTPEDSKRDRERDGGDTGRENEEARTENKINSYINSQHLMCISIHIQHVSVRGSVFVSVFLCCCFSTASFIVYKCQGWKIISLSAYSMPWWNLCLCGLERERVRQQGMINYFKLFISKHCSCFCFCYILGLTPTSSYFL